MALMCPHCHAPQAKAQQKFCSRCGHALLTTTPAPVSNVRTTFNNRTQRMDQAATQARLSIEDSGQTRTIALGTQSLTLGRAPYHGIVLISPFVSTDHARIEPDGVGHRIVDVGSTNGLLYQGRRIAAFTPQTLTDGDTIRIGDPISGNFVTLTYFNPAAAPMQPLGRVDLPTSPGATLLIGRDHGGGIWTHPQVSRDHASITVQPDGSHLLRDLHSTNGSYVNGARISSHILHAGEIVQIGPFKLCYGRAALIQQDHNRAMRLEARGLSMQRPNTALSLPQRAQYWLRGQRVPSKCTLQDVSLCIEPGEFVALVGGSGAGKSTLMGALSGFNRATSGTVHVNGDDFYRNFDAYRAVLGYVPQDDIVHRMLPVRRALQYTARLRLPTDTTATEVDDRIRRVLQDVDMTEHAGKLVDQLSGGQRKRVSISAELLADPSLFFLDEPTSGLDPGLEKKMMYTLRRLADGGRTVVLVTHATANIDQCDLVAFLAAGRLVYYGPPQAAKQFFGVTSDDFADIYTRIDGRYDPADPVIAQDATIDQAYHAWRVTHGTQPQPPLLAELWEARFRGSPQYQQYVQQRLGSAAQGSPSRANARPSASTPPVSSWRQWRLLTRRYLDLALQDRRNVAILLLQAPIIALLMALVLQRDALTGSDATFGSARSMLFTLATVGVWFGIINAAREITKEAPIYRRERLANLRVVPYVLSKMAVLSGFVVAQSLMLLLIVGLAVEFPARGLLMPASAELWATTLLASVGGLALGLLISSVAATPDRAISIVPLALIPQIIFSGVVFTLEGGAKVLSWLAIGRWTMDAYGAIAHINRLPTFIGGQPPTPSYSEYTHSVTHLIGRWGILLFGSLVCLALTMWLLQRRDARQ